MAQRVVIAVDVLGGDIGPSVVLPGIEKALQADSELEVIACGPADVVEPFAEKHDRVRAQVTTEEIAMDEHPANAVKRKIPAWLLAINLLRRVRLKDSSQRDLPGRVSPLLLWWWAVLRAFPVLPCALLSHRLLSPW